MGRATLAFWSIIVVLLCASAFYGISAEKQRRSVQSASGKIESGDLVRLVKVIDGEESTDVNDTWVIAKAAPTGSATFEYTKDKQSVYAVTFKGYADTSANNRIAYLGDPAAV